MGEESRCRESTAGGREAAVSEEDIRMIKKVHRILAAGKNVEIKRDTNGRPKFLKVSRELA